MIRVTVGNNIDRNVVIVDENTSLRSCLEENNIDYSRSTVHLDGAPITAGNMDRTFADFGVTDRCYLFSITKADNA